MSAATVILEGTGAMGAAVRAAIVRREIVKVRGLALALVALAGSLLAGCAGEAQRSDGSRTATPYVRENVKSEAPASKGPVTVASKTGGAVPDAGAPPSGAGLPIVYETDDETPVAIDAAAGEGKKGPILAVIRFEEGRPALPGAADLEALAPERAGTAKTLGTPRPLAPEAIPDPPSGGRRTIRSLREASGRMGAEKLLIARTIRSGKERLLEASLHDVASGEVLGRYGPSEPSMSIAAASLHRLVSR